MGEFTERLRTEQNDKERAMLKADAMSRVTAPNAFNVGPHRVTISDLSLDGDMVRFNVHVKRGNKDVTPPDLNPVRVHNPPILVPDAAGEVEVVRVSPERHGVQEVATVKRYREDPQVVLVEIVTDLIRHKVG